MFYCLSFVFLFHLRIPSFDTPLFGKRPEHLWIISSPLAPFVNSTVALHNELRRNVSQRFILLLDSIMTTWLINVSDYVPLRHFFFQSVPSDLTANCNPPALLYERQIVCSIRLRGVKLLWHDSISKNIERNTTWMILLMSPLTTRELYKILILWIMEIVRNNREQLQNEKAAIVHSASIYMTLPLTFVFVLLVHTLCGTKLWHEEMENKR